MEFEKNQVRGNHKKEKDRETRMRKLYLDEKYLILDKRRLELELEKCKEQIFERRGFIGIVTALWGSHKRKK